MPSPSGRLSNKRPSRNHIGNHRRLLRGPPIHFQRRNTLKQLQPANDNSPRPATVFFLMAQYNGKVVISVEEICRDYFPHLDSAKFIRKVSAGDITIPMIRMEASQKAAKGVHINDLADYIDRQADAARKECRQLAS